MCILTVGMSAGVIIVIILAVILVIVIIVVAVFIWRLMKKERYSIQSKDIDTIR